MEIKAHAKINLCLNVVGKRADGYHELEMIMLPLTLHDIIHISLATSDTYTCSDTSLEMDASNTVVKAVELMRKTFSFKEHFAIHVEKHIPAQAGLAGGSADGAAVLRGIKELLALPITIAELSMLGKQIGADIPFCVYQTSAVVKGIGEIVQPFTYDCPFHILLVKPQVGVSTPQAFKTLDYDACDHPSTDKVVEYLCADRFEELHAVISNSLEYSAFKIEPIIQDIKAELYDMKFPAVLMSGSGSTVFALSRDIKQIEKAMEYFKEKGMFVCHTEVQR